MSSSQREFFFQIIVKPEEIHSFYSICASRFTVSLYSPQTTSALVPQGPYSIFNFNTILDFEITGAALRNRNSYLSHHEKVTVQYIRSQKRPW